MSGFNWRSRLAWIGRTDSGVVRQRLYDRGILGLGLSVLDPGAPVWAKAIRDEGKANGAFVCWYSDPHWFGLAVDGRALAYRQRVDADLARLALPGEMVMLDLEQVSADYVRRLFNGSPGNRGLVNSGRDGYDGTQTDRPIAYTNEPFKNHTVVPMDVFSDCPDLHWYSQLYYGDMSPADGVADVLEILRDYEAWVMPASDIAQRVHPFYDGMRIASDQRDGAYFTAERIPDVFSTRFANVNAASGQWQFTKDSLRAHYTNLYVQKEAA